jgi:hypothetical protein
MIRITLDQHGSRWGAWINGDSFGVYSTATSKELAVRRAVRVYRKTRQDAAGRRGEEETGPRRPRRGFQFANTPS